MSKLELLNKELMRYGFIKKHFITDSNNGTTTIRVIEYQSKTYWHHMYNGNIVEITEL